ncbi:hypothetical protein [Brevibacillus fulvus]|uniref:Uncharacterized protein n=1 Tax=Brevibacillus fulvus TaxID=1125967 RepID=A0A938Y0E1_9BACL|nr:hypothetical protein [Brevibacillus fulvus]MBM7588835.1 hypothetical protein [Brevibacillus fulvus]
MVSVDIGSLTWQQFWIAAAYLAITGCLFSLGILRLFQQRIKSGVIMLVICVITTVMFVAYVYEVAGTGS